MQPLFEVRRYRRAAITHSHDFHQLVLPIEGRLNMFVGTIKGVVSAQSLALVAAGQAHNFAAAESDTFLVVDVPVSASSATEVQALALWQHARVQPFVQVDAQLLQLIRYLAMASETGQLRGALNVHGCGLLLATIATQLGVADQNTWPESLRTIAGYVEAHLQWPLSVADLARAANLSGSRLHALFQQHLATTPQSFLTERRLHRAKKLIENTSLSIAEVAHRVGYDDQSAFTRAFRRHTGQAPLSYRRASTARHKSK
jgi:AraC-like DNA-binding protein